MEINWLTLIAQIVNFIILLFLLKAILYKRVLDAIRAREEKIASSLDAAEKLKEKAEKEIEEYSKKKKEMDDAREDLLSQAKRDVETQKHDLLEKAREDVSQSRKRWLKSLEERERGFLNEVRDRVARQVYEISGRALALLANARLEEQTIAIFFEKVASLSDERLEKMRESLKKPESKIIVESAFEIPETERQRIKALINERIMKDARVDFATSPGVICGIRLKSGEIEIAWTFEEYLNAMEQNVSRIFDEEIRKNKQTGGDEPDSPEASE